MSSPFSNVQLWSTIAATGFCMGYFVLPWLCRIILRDYFEIDEEGFSSDSSSHSGDPLPLPLKSRLLLGLIGGLVTCLAFAKLGNSHDTLVFCAFFYGLIALCFINLKVLMLPDRLVLPLLWGGLIYHSVSSYSTESVLGAGAAYCASWGLYKLYLRRRGRECFGGGDLKCFALTGAWFGYRSLPIVFGSWLASSILYAAALVILKRPPPSFCPSGPFHLIAALAAFLSMSTLP